jgi:hypothetical protein
MKVHIGQWAITDSNKVITACGVTLDKVADFVYPPKRFMEHTNPNDLCKRCKQIYEKKPW